MYDLHTACAHVVQLRAEECTVASLRAGSVLVEWRMTPGDSCVHDLADKYQKMVANRDPVLVS